MNYILGISIETWAGAVLGAIVSAIFTLFATSARRLRRWWSRLKPINRVLGPISDDEEPCTIFVRDFLLSPGSTILAVEPRIGSGIVPNVQELWSDVEGKGMSYVFNALGQAGKRENISIVRMSQDPGIWNTNLIVMGAQAQKCFDFYAQMNGIAYAVDAVNIFESDSRAIVNREPGYGYGIILKAKNPHKTAGAKGIAFLIGGYGTLGTAVAAYYFKEHLKELGKKFGKHCFGVVVRASVTAGEQSAERLVQHDRVLPN